MDFFLGLRDSRHVASAKGGVSDAQSSEAAGSPEICGRPAVGQKDGNRTNKSVGEGSIRNAGWKVERH